MEFLNSFQDLRVHGRVEPSQVVELQLRPHLGFPDAQPQVFKSLKMIFRPNAVLI